MGEEVYIYDRDRNISGVTAPADYSTLGFTPVYGSQVEFAATNQSFQGRDYYNNTIPSSLNSLSARFQLRYDLNETNARKLVNFLESKEGNTLFKLDVDNQNIYRSLTGVCDNYAVNHINNQRYEVGVTFDVDQAPTLLNWSGSTFTNYSFQDWVGGQSFKKYDVVYSGINTNKIDNFYYSTQDHTSQSSNSPTGANSFWSQEFFFAPDIGLTNEVNIKNNKLNFKNSYPLRLKYNDNSATLSLSYTFSKITNKQALSILHFLENRAGYQKFLIDIPSVYNRKKVMFSPRWTHTFLYHNAHNIEVTLEEDPLGIDPRATND